MLEVRIYENNKCIWMRRKEDQYGMTNRNYIKDGTYLKIKEVLEESLEQVNGNLGVLDISDTVSNCSCPSF